MRHGDTQRDPLINRLADCSSVRQSNKCWIHMSRILHSTLMMAEDPDPTTDKVGINTMLQCDRSDRGIRIFTGIDNTEFEFWWCIKKYAKKKQVEF